MGYIAAPDLLCEYFKGGKLTYGTKQSALVSKYCMENMYGEWTELFGTFYFEREEDMFMVKMVYGFGFDDDIVYNKLFNNGENFY